MKVDRNYKCFDCGKPIEGKPILVLRHLASGVVRVNVCIRCQHGGTPQKKASLNVRKL